MLDGFGAEMVLDAKGEAVPLDHLMRRNKLHLVTRWKGAERTYLGSLFAAFVLMEVALIPRLFFGRP